MSAADTIEVFGALAEGGAEVRFVGGCVRDAILGRAVSDIDLATDAEPNRILELLGEKKIRAAPDRRSADQFSGSRKTPAR